MAWVLPWKAKDRNVYEVVNLFKGQKAIKNFWVFNIKSNGCYRSQLVAKEFLAVAALKDWNIHSVDVKTAYLYNNLDEKIYME